MLYALTLVAFTTTASAEGATKTSPFEIDNAKLAGYDLDVIPPLSEGVVSGGDPAPKLTVLFRGDVVFGVFESKTTKLDVKEGWPYDEYVMVLAGELHLTDAATKTTQVFTQGDQVIIPKGFTGAWQHIGDPYRETFMIERKTFEAVWGPE